jgi:DNA-directed RNA polymerase subunit RPC12/RpoP
LIDLEDLFCAGCGRETPPPAGDDGGGGGDRGRASRVEDGFVGFQCESCGASVTYDADRQGLRCAFCGSVSMAREEAPTGRIQAERFVPFEVSREDAERLFRAWIAKGLFRPFGIRSLARLVSIEPLYLPFWRFRAETHTYYAGDSSRTPPGARADWCPVFGERSGSVENVLVGATGALSASELEALEPFDFSRRRPYHREELKGHGVEDFGLGRRGARPRARAAMLRVEKALCAAEIPGRSRNVGVNTIFTNLRSEPVLLPIWINAYRYKEETYRFIVNGQSGRASGTAPVSYLKLALVALAALALAGAVAAVAAS